MARIFKFEVFWISKERLVFWQYEESPDYLIIHCRVNNIGAINLYTLIEKTKTPSFIKVWIPQSTHIWSQMYPRNNWYSKDNKAMERCRLKANGVTASPTFKLVVVTFSTLIFWETRPNFWCLMASTTTTYETSSFSITSGGGGGIRIRSIATGVGL